MARVLAIYRTIGKTPRNGHCARRRVSERNRRTAAALSAEIDRSLQTRRKHRTITGYCNNKIHRPVGAGQCPARDITAAAIYRVNRIEGFPLWGKLAAKPTDEGVSAGHFPLIRRVPRHLPPKGKAFR